MSSRKINFRGLTTRLVVWSTILLIISVVGVSSTIYVLLSQSLRKTDQDNALRQAAYFEKVFFENGADLLRKEVPPELSLVIYKGSDVVFESEVKKIDDDFEDEREVVLVQKMVNELPLKHGWQMLIIPSDEQDSFFEALEYKLSHFALKRNWIQILPLIDDDIFEVYVTKIRSPYWMKIGHSPEVREEQLARIRTIAFYVFIPFCFLGVLLSFILAKGILSPIQQLGLTIKKIRSGNKSLRGQVSQREDEVDGLTTEFNSLLDENETLVQNLKSTIDNVAHDLRTPMTRFRMSAEDALKSKDDVNKLRESLSDALENSENILKLLHSIMDVSEAESKSMSIRDDKIDLKPLIESIAELYEFTAEEKGIKLNVDVFPTFVRGDEIRLTQAIGNVVDNAIKFSPEKSTVSLAMEVHGTDVRVLIKDQGPGVQDSEKMKIWDRLYRGDESRSTPGLGIGLSLVKAIITVHGGHTDVLPNTPQGSIFVLTLPICHEEEIPS